MRAKKRRFAGIAILRPLLQLGVPDKIHREAWLTANLKIAGRIGVFHLSFLHQFPELVKLLEKKCTGSRILKFLARVALTHGTPQAKFQTFRSKVKVRRGQQTLTLLPELVKIEVSLRYRIAFQAWANAKYLVEALIHETFSRTDIRFWPWHFYTAHFMVFWILALLTQLGSS